MAYQVDPPETGVWALDDFPEVISIDGVNFIKAIRKQPYTGVIEQYRQDTPRNSAHLMVLEDGTWRIDHVDEYNPDQGFPLRHYLKDHPKSAATILGGIGVAGLAAAAIKGAKDREEKDNG